MARILFKIVLSVLSKLGILTMIEISTMMIVNQVVRIPVQDGLPLIDCDDWTVMIMMKIYIHSLQKSVMVLIVHVMDEQKVVLTEMRIVMIDVLQSVFLNINYIPVNPMEAGRDLLLRRVQHKPFIIPLRPILL